MPHGVTKVEISTGSIVRLISLVILVILLYLLKDVLIIFLFALVLAAAISPFANWLESKGIPRIWGVLLLFLIVIGLLGLLLSLVIPGISDDVSRLRTDLPEIVSRVSTSLDDVQKESPRYFDFISEIQNGLDSISVSLQRYAQSAFGIVIGIFGGVLSFIAVLVISFYLSVMKKGIEAFLGSVVPDRYEAYVVDLWRRVEVKMGKWLQGQILLALIVGLMVFVGLSLLDIRFALILGILAMVLEIVPIVGPVLAAIPAVFLAFMQSPSLGLWVIIFYVAVQQIENHILVPLVLGKTVGLNPVVVIISLLVGGHLAGIAGMILAVPVATVIVEIIDDMAKHKEEVRNKEEVKPTIPLG